MAIRRVPARAATVFEDLAVPRPASTGVGGSATIVRSFPARAWSAFPSETTHRFPRRKSLRSVVFSFAVTVARYSAKRAYLRSQGVPRDVARRKALWHIR